jgi:hypothetical protein
MFRIKAEATRSLPLSEISNSAPTAHFDGWAVTELRSRGRPRFERRSLACGTRATEAAFIRPEIGLGRGPEMPSRKLNQIIAAGAAQNRDHFEMIAVCAIGASGEALA